MQVVFRLVFLLSMDFSDNISAGVYLSSAVPAILIPIITNILFLIMGYGGVRLGAFVGGKYYFNDKIGAFAELGYGISVLQIGLAGRF